MILSKYKPCCVPFPLFYMFKMFFFLFSGCFLMGQSPSYRISHFSGEQGLSESHVFSISQDNKGFLWFGTRDGLNRFDGYEFKIYRHNPDDPNSLSNNYIYAVYVDDEGIIWLGSRGGLNRFNREEEVFTHYRHNPEDPSSLAHDTVYGIKPATGPWAGSLWAATANGGLSRFNPETGKFTNHRHRPEEPSSIGNNAVRCIEVGPDGAIWAGTEEGLYYMSPQEPGRFIGYVHERGNKSSLSHNKVTALHLDIRGILWIGTESGVDQLDGSGKLTRIRAPSGERFGFTTTLLGDGQSGIWIGSTRLGLHHYSLESQKYRLFDMKINPDGLVSMSIDRNDTLWLGFYGNGVVHMSPTAFMHEGVREDEVSALLKDRDGGLWIGKRGASLEHRDGKGSKTLYSAGEIEGLKADTVTSLLEDDRGRIWVGGDNTGLACYNPQTNAFLTNLWKESDGHMGEGWVGSMVEAGGNLWLGTDRGLKSVDLSTLSNIVVYKPTPSDRSSISDLGIPSLYYNAKSKEDLLWIGTWNGGLNRMSLNAPGRFKHYKSQKHDSNSISANGILSIHEAANGQLWLGTTNGLSRFDPTTGQADSWYMKDGLPGNTIYCVLPDGTGRLWLSTSHGLSNFDPKTEQFRNYDWHDGLRVEDYRENCGFVESDGSLVFGGNGGWVNFLPHQITINEDPPQMAITQFKLDNRIMDLQRRDPSSPLEKVIEETQSIGLSHKNRAVEFHFTALHYMAPEKNGYAYRLENFDPDWVETNALNRHAIYTNLDPGSYTFKVKGSNKDGIWGEQTSIRLKVPAPPWLSWWAYAFYALILLFIIGAYLRFLHHKLEKQRLSLEHLRQMERMKDAFNLELEGKVEERTRELKGARKKLMETARSAGMAEIASDVLHNVGNTLNSARTSLHLIQEKVEDYKGIELLGKIASIFRENEDQLDECLGKKFPLKNLPDSLERIHHRLKENQGGLERECMKLHDKVQAMVVSLRKQQEHVHPKSILMEWINLEDLLAEALLAASPILAEIECKTLSNKALDVYVDRLKALRIISFIIQNAVESIGARNSETRGQIVFATGVSGDEVQLKISDNGIGVPSDGLSQLYVHGYTTKAEREGLGLHYCANAMKEMAGRVDIANKEQGEGAVVTLVFSGQHPENNYEI